MIGTTLAVVFSGLVLANPIHTCNCSIYLGKVIQPVKENTVVKENSIEIEKAEEIEEPKEIKAIEKNKEIKEVEKTEEIEDAEEIKEIEVKPKKISLGEFKLTAYCSCEKCCGSYAKNRPVDKYGNKIVYGSSGKVLKEGISVAVDTKVIPFGTKVIINDKEYIAQDTGGAIKGNKIDVYFEDHQRASDFGVKYEEVFFYNTN